MPWIADGTRFFGTPAARAQFAALAEQMLVRAGAFYRTISGDWPAREAAVRAALSE